MKKSTKKSVRMAPTKVAEIDPKIVKAELAKKRKAPKQTR